MREGKGGGSHVLVATLIALHSVGAQMQPARVAMEHWVLDRWSTDQGLPQNTIESVLQTRDGYLWIATFGGLVRFDGVRFTAFTTRDYPGLGSDRVMALAPARDGGLWIGTDRGLVRFAGGRFREWTVQDGRPAGFTEGLIVDSTGAVWMSASIGGAARFADSTFTPLTSLGVPEGWVGSIVADSAGGIWLQRGSKPPAVLRSGARRFAFVSIAATPHTTDDVGRFWMSTSTGIAQYTGGRLIPFPIRGNGMLVGDGAGGEWLSLPRGLFHRDSAGHVDSVLATPDNGLGDVRHLFVDRERTLWIGTTTYGLLRLRPRLFDMVDRSKGLAVPAVTAVMRDSRGRLWVGSSCDTTTIFTTSGVRHLKDPGCVFSFAETADGIVWAGSYSGGVNRIEPDYHFRQITDRDGLPNNVVFALYADPDTSLWIGTDNGLAHMVHGAIQVYTTVDGLPSTQVHFITRDHAGRLWVGTEGGVARLDGDHFRAWTARDGLAHNNVRAIYQDSAGMYWIGTYGGGLSRFDGTRFVTISTRDGLCDDVVSAILEDARGYFWMSGNRGVYRVQRAALDAFARGESPNVSCVTYGPSDGLLTSETNGGFQPSAWQDRDGTLWFATIRGLATVHPSEATAHTTPAEVAIETVRADGAALAGRDVTLPPGTRYLEITYTGLTSIAPEQLQFRYRMQGLDTGWVYVGNRRTAYFSKLAPGHYHFVVSAGTRDGVWSDSTQALALTVLAPWYATLWFRVLAVLALAAAGVLAVRQRLAHLHEQQRIQREFARHLLTGQETERRRLAGELHDSLGQDLLVMKNRAAMALRSGDLDAATRAHIEEISAVASQAVQNARDISHALRPYQLDRLGLVAALRDLAARASTPGATGLQVVVDAGAEDDAEPALDAEAATHVYRIAQEALNNILKHADARHADIVLRREPAGLRVIIRDDGRGADLARGLGFGLTGIAQRARLLGGTFDVRTSPRSGTTLDVFVPAQRAGRAPATA